MSPLDWGVVGLYLVLALGLGLYMGRRGSRNMVEFFVSGRELPWWLAGTGMAAAAFSIDTPLYVSGVVARQGIAGNWQWWSFAISHVLLVFVFARLWRRAEVITDAELTEIRYGGHPAAVLRGLKAFIFAVPINVIGLGYAMLAAKKVFVALGLASSLPAGLGSDPELAAVIIITVLTLLYAGAAGLWGVVTADFFQFFLALFGAILVAVIAIAHVGGLHALRSGLIAHGLGDRMAFFPIGQASELALTTFLAYVGIQWWAFRRSDGGGEFVQRLSAARTEVAAERAAILFNILHYVMRTWPWILVGLVALLVYPNMLAPGGDPEIAYPRLMLEFLPEGLLGLVVASLVAAFMSVASVHINWGASYITNDLYKRFMHRTASQRELVWVGRIASFSLAVMAAWVAFNASSIGTIFTFIIAIGTGPGAVLVLRWFWWRINAWAEIASMVAGLLIALILYTPEIHWGNGFLGTPLGSLASLVRPVFDYGNAGILAVTAFGTAAIWLAAMFMTAPESDEVLDDFYRRTRPGGPGWRRQRERTGLAPLENLGADLISTLLGIFSLFGAMFAIGAGLLLRWSAAGIWACICVVATALLLHVRHREMEELPPPEQPAI